MGPRAGRPSSRAFGERQEVQALGIVHLVLAAHTNKIVVGRSARCFIMAREDGPRALRPPTPNSRARDPGKTRARVGLTARRSLTRFRGSVQ